MFFKRRARQLLKAMFTLHDLHWIAATLNPRTRMLKLATDTERAHAHSLVRSEWAKIIEVDQVNDSTAVQSSTAVMPPSPPKKKFKSYTAQFNDDGDYSQSHESATGIVRARHELDMYLQLNLTKCMYPNDDEDNPLLFWKEQESVLPNLSKLAKKTFCIPASSAAVERTFSSAGVVVSQRRNSISPSLVNDIILVRSAATHLKDVL